MACISVNHYTCIRCSFNLFKYMTFDYEEIDRLFLYYSISFFFFYPRPPPPFFEIKFKERGNNV